MTASRQSMTARCWWLTLILGTALLAGWWVWGRESSVPVRAVASLVRELVEAAPAAKPSQEPNPAAKEVQAEPPPLLVDITQVVAHRATEAERADFQRRSDNDADLSALAIELKQRAETGDSDAAAALVKLHARCADALQVPARPSKPVLGMPAPPPTLAQRCAGFGPPGELTALNSRSTAAAWRHTAAQLGDATSRMLGDGSYPRAGSPQALERQRGAEELLRRGDYAELLDNTHGLTSLSTLDSQHAWRPTLCALNRPCTSERCRAACDDRQDSGWKSLAPREQRVALGQQAAILGAIRSSRYDVLWWPSSVGGATP